MNVSASVRLAPLALVLLAGSALGQNTQRVDKSAGNAIATTGSGTAFVNGDSSMVFFVSSASNLLPAGQDTNGAADVYCRNRTNNTVVRISVPDPSMPTTQSNGASTLCHGGARCTDILGRFVVFTSDADNLVANDTNGVSDVFVRDRDLDDNGIMDEPGIGKTRTVRVSVSSSEAQATGNCPNQTCTHYSYGGTISTDGRFVAFVSGADLTTDSVPYTNIYLRDRDADNDGLFDEAGGSPNAATTTGSSCPRRCGSSARAAPRCCAPSCWIFQRLRRFARRLPIACSGTCSTATPPARGAG